MLNKIYMPGCYTYRCFLLGLFYVFCAVEADAQKSEGIYSNALKAGSTIYIITNRVENTDPGKPYYINEINHHGPLVYLKASVLTGDSMDVSRLEEKELISKIQSSDNDWLLFVHGDSKTFEQAVWRGFDIQHLHDVNVIVFSWPSRDPDLGGTKNFKNSKKNVIRSMENFKELLQFMGQLRQKVPSFSEGTHLSVFFHSLGNYYLENFVRERAYLEIDRGIFDNLVINAAAVNQDGHKQWVEMLTLQKQAYITCNKQDFNLKGVRIFTKDGKQLGEKITLPLADNANYIHFTDAVGFRFPTGTTHTYFIGEITDKSLNISHFYKEIFHGREIDLEEGNMFIKRDDGLGYDIIFKNK
jgi:esterase/lipase superfamily enzyme